MKRLAPIVLALLLAAPVYAAPDIVGADAALAQAETAAQKTAAELAAVRGQRDALERVLMGAADVSAEKDKVIKDRDATIAADQKQFKRDRDARVNLISGSIGVPGGILVGLGVACLVLGLTLPGIRCVLFGGAMVAIAVGIAVYSAKIAVAGAIAAVLLLVAAIAWLVWDVRQHKDAAKTQANLMPLAAKAGVLADDTLLAMKKIRAQISGKLAKKITSEVTGKPAAQLDAEAAVPLTTSPVGTL